MDSYELLGFINSLPPDASMYLGQLWCDHDNPSCWFRETLDLSITDIIAKRVNEHVKETGHKEFSFKVHVELEVSDDE